MHEVKTAPWVAFKERILSRREIEGMIAEGRHIVIFDGKVLKTDSWIQFHPGGDKPIKHMVGRDATDEINALHSRETCQQMLSFQIGRIEGRWINFRPPIQGGKFRRYSKEQDCAIVSDSSSQTSTRSSSPMFDAIETWPGIRQRQSTSTANSSIPQTPQTGQAFEPRPFFLDARTQQEIVLDIAKYPPLDPASQDNIIKKYRALDDRIRTEGLYNCNYFAYVAECCRYVLIAAVSLFFLRLGWYGTSGLFLGCFWHQLVFTAHDAGHMGITHHFHVDTIIGVIIANYLGGLSLGWWKRSHNVHHIVTNSPEHDPDIEHMPVFAVSHRFLTNLRSTYYDRILEFDAIAKFALKYQKYLYYPILLLGRFNLYRLSWEYLLLGYAPKKGPAWWHWWFEVGGQAFFWLWFGYGVVYCSIPDWTNRLLFVFVSHMVTGPLHLQITLSHFAMSTADLGIHESFPQKMLRTTMDVDCPTWLDFLHGGLQFQAIHHLYPRIPRHNLRRTQKLVMEFCREVNIPYAIYTFVDGNKEVLGRLGDVAKQVRILEECKKAWAQQGLFSGRHHD